MRADIDHVARAGPVRCRYAAREGCVSRDLQRANGGQQAGGKGKGGGINGWESERAVLLVLHSVSVVRAASFLLCLSGWLGWLVGWSVARAALAR